MGEEMYRVNAGFFKVCSRGVMVVVVVDIGMLLWVEGCRRGGRWGDFFVFFVGFRVRVGEVGGMGMGEKGGWGVVCCELRVGRLFLRVYGFSDVVMRGGFVGRC